ncbi:serine/threonine-protein kinase 16-like isoform X2 [Anthonomus grandis grandis]|uniref:serine/threonine-protein kinase 16-like isoform X2 n=1 Tax=Anthonomus grandis grandis TaxID=2921223 RepID=UPI0021661CA5|nr:serine/threonine-protein kinase 16-like isoform X2 [Anthonomus grandis grandis]
MNTLGLSTLLRLGCICGSESIDINGIRYNVKDLLGEGGFSCVELVEQSSTRKKFALKRIKCHSTEDEKIASQEITYCKRLKHPNIIELVDSCMKGSADPVVQSISEAFLLLPYFKRGTLHDYLALRSFSKNYLDTREVIRLFSDICQALKYMHEFSPEPVAHRDIKPGNVCLTDNMDPVLMDLGSCAPAKVQVCGSQDAQKLEDVAAERCSMTYRAPELFHVESYCVIDERTDIWGAYCMPCYTLNPLLILFMKGVTP